MGYGSLFDLQWSHSKLGVIAPLAIRHLSIRGSRHIDSYSYCENGTIIQKVRELQEAGKRH